MQWFNLPWNKPLLITPQHKVRIVTAASLFDGHDAAINIMRRIMQRSGCEVIHLGHDRSVDEVVNCAIQEDAQGIAMTSYQGGHMEYFKYMKDLLEEKGAGHIRIFGGGGGTILPEEIAELHAYGIERIYHPDDGRAMGLQGMINDLVQRADFETVHSVADVAEELKQLSHTGHRGIARCITAAENDPDGFSAAFKAAQADVAAVPVLGITGTGGAGKSSMVDELVRRFLMDFPDKRIGLISVDPSKRKTGGALLGDRIRMNAIHNERVLYAVIGDPTIQFSAVQARVRSGGGAQGQRVRPHRIGNERHWPERHRDHGPQRRGLVPHDT